MSILVYLYFLLKVLYFFKDLMIIDFICLLNIENWHEL